jgi:two-component system sensor histidine kinase KdpD
MNAPFYVMFVSSPERFLTKVESLHIETCEKLCEEFGGEFVRVESRDIKEAISKIAAQYRITQIVLGETRKSRWDLLWRGSIVQQLMRSLPQIDLHIIANTTKDT